MTTQPLCVYRSSDVWICTVHASVCACVRKENLFVVTQRATCACTLRQLHKAHIHETHTQTHSSSCSPFSTLSWALPVTPHGDFALCQLSYSNKPLRHWGLLIEFILFFLLLHNFPLAVKDSAYLFTEKEKKDLSARSLSSLMVEDIFRYK